MAVDATGWELLEPTNLYDSDPATEATYEVPFSPITTNLMVAPPNTAKVRYQLEFDNAATDGGAVYFDDCVLEKLVGSDPDITNPPVAVTIYAGLPAEFAVVATRAQKPEVLTYQWQKNGTNLPAGGGVNDITGTTTTSTLSMTNCQAADSGLFSVVVTDISTNTPPVTNSITSVPVPLTVLTESPLQKANALGANSGFENAPVFTPFKPFNGAYFVTSTNVYGTSTETINIFDGNWSAEIGDNGDRDNGFYIQIPAAANTVWKANGWAYVSSSNNISDGNTCRLQIWFVDSTGVTVPGTSTYESFKIYGSGYTNVDTQYTNIDTSSPNFGQVEYHALLPLDEWVFMPV
ncbi:MAG TPA: hypothetical protein VKJ65_08665, partial [Phycisphaerae bacterium]|nr:hypothetical protein [Phycisphaerae bacterium]